MDNFNESRFQRILRHSRFHLKLSLLLFFVVAGNSCYLWNFILPSLRSCFLLSLIKHFSDVFNIGIWKELDAVQVHPELKTSYQNLKHLCQKSKAKTL